MGDTSTQSNSPWPPSAFKVGRDKVWFEGPRVLICAAREIPDWTVREFCRHPIFFRGEKYYLQQRLPAPRPFAIIYDLAPWPDDRYDTSNRTFTYDEQFVRDRDANARIEVGREGLHYLLLFSYPLLGFLWSRTKDRVLVPLGFEPRGISWASMMLEIGLFMMDGILFGFLGGGIVRQSVGVTAAGAARGDLYADVLDLAILAVLFLDWVMRYNHYLKHEGTPDGFLEWLFRPFKKRN